MLSWLRGLNRVETEMRRVRKENRLVMKGFCSLRRLERTEKQLDPMRLPATIAKVRSIELWLKPSF